MELNQIKKPTNSSVAGQSGDPLIGQESEEISLGEVIAIILDYKWRIVAITLLSLLIGIAVILIRTPVYRAAGLIQVEDKSSGFGKLETLEPFLGGNTSIAAEIEILTSRMILERVIAKQKLDIVVEAVTFPLIGGVISRRYVGDVPNAPWLGFSSYAWGGEVIQIDSLDVPREYLDQSLLLTAGEAGSFAITDNNGLVVLNGTVGRRANDNGISIFVSQIKARAGTRFRLVKCSQETAVDDLLKHFMVKERGRQSGILELSFTGRNPDEIRAVLDEIQTTYLRLNVERRSAQAEKTLGFLETQLPVLKEQVNRAEDAYNSYRQARGSLDLNLETQGVLKLLVDIEDATLLLKQEREELRRRFTTEHPTIQAIDAKLARLNERSKQAEKEVARLPDTQQAVLRLARDMEVSTNLYTTLLNSAQQLKVSKAGTIGEVRIIDSAAVSSQPVGVNPSAILGIAFMLGLLGSVVTIMFMRMLRVVIDDPESIEAKLGLPVYATVPHSKVEATLSRKRRKGVASGELLAVIKPDDDAVECLRSLRATLHFALLDTQHNSLLITGSSPKLGKSFLAKNLGVVLAQLGKRIVIVDADLRRGYINKGFNLERNIGVSEFITGQATIMEVIKSTSIPDLYVVTSGQMPPNPSELLMHMRFKELLSELNKSFDTVIIDAPPVLAVSDAAIIGRHVGATLVVARAGRHPIQELEQAVKRLNQAGVLVKGFIFNDLNIARQRNRYGYKGFVFNYSYK